MGSVQGFYRDGWSGEGSFLGDEEFFCHGGVLFGIDVEEILRPVGLDIAVTLRSDRIGSTHGPCPPSDMAGKLVHGPEGGLPGSRQFYETTVFLVPDLILADDLVTYSELHPGIDLDPADLGILAKYLLVEMPLDSEAVAG
jgi:hypothetical protein